MSLVTKAKTLSRLLHGRQRYGGQPYFEAHVEAVVARVREMARDAGFKNPACLSLYVELAYLHDVLEDTPCTAADLLDLGFDPYLVSKVQRITRRRDETYSDFILRVKLDPVATFVKIADLECNLAACPVRGELVKRYERALSTLREDV